MDGGEGEISCEVMKRDEYAVGRNNGVGRSPSGLDCVPGEVVFVGDIIIEGGSAISCDEDD